MDFCFSHFGIGDCGHQNEDDKLFFEVLGVGKREGRFGRVLYVEVQIKNFRQPYCSYVYADSRRLSGLVIEAIGWGFLFVEPVMANQESDAL